MEEKQYIVDLRLDQRHIHTYIHTGRCIIYMHKAAASKHRPPMIRGYLTVGLHICMLMLCAAETLPGLLSLEPYKLRLPGGLIDF